jgi:hypothetical protein
MLKLGVCEQDKEAFMKSFRTLSSFLVLALLGGCFAAGTASAQDSKGRSSSWENLKSLTPGQEIRVIMNNFKSYQGEFESFSDDGITLRQAAGKQTLVRNDVFRVSQKLGQDHQTRNALTGMVVGAGSGLGIGLAANHVIWSQVNCDEGPAFNCGYPPNPHWGIILTPAGFLAGALIGAAIPTHAWRDIYRAH